MQNQGNSPANEPESLEEIKIAENTEVITHKEKPEKKNMNESFMLYHSSFKENSHIE